MENGKLCKRIAHPAGHSSNANKTHGPTATSARHYQKI